MKVGRSSVKGEDLPNIAKALGVDISIFFESKLSDTLNCESEAI